jgi:tryptophanyl-tRNA synthetase
VLMLDQPDAINRKFKTAVTDSGREIAYEPDEKPGVSNLLEILAVASGRAIPDVASEYEGKGYGDLKGDTADAVIEFVKPVQQRYAELRADESELKRLLSIGADKAQTTSAPTLHHMYERMGFVAR